MIHHNVYIFVFTITPLSIQAKTKIEREQFGRQGQKYSRFKSGHRATLWDFGAPRVKWVGEPDLTYAKLSKKFRFFQILFLGHLWRNAMIWGFGIDGMSVNIFSASPIDLCG